MNLPDLERLEALAEKATPGPWKAYDSHGVCVGALPSATCVADMSPGSSDPAWNGRREDAAFIAAASPDVVLALVARVRELEEALTSACRIIEEATQSESQYGDYQDDPDWRLAQHFRSLLARGTP